MENRNCLLGFCLLFLTAQAAAQFRIGVQAGASVPGGSRYSTQMPYYFGGTMRVETTGSGGLVFGLFTLPRLNNRIYLRPSADLAFRGFKKTQIPPQAPSYSYTDGHSYLDLAFPVVYNFSNKPGGFYGGGGPGLSFLLSNQYGSTQVRSTTVGLNGLLSYVFPLDFSLNASYHLGLTNALLNSTDGSFKNSFFNITIGYLF
ncbi:outer membrane beta-barrel protein [Flavisolibacter ginsenosidimutans]|nr:outer membrane beta-barrel protein [Flavisolibacter ginsenosidimutans]